MSRVKQRPGSWVSSPIGVAASRHVLIRRVALRSMAAGYAVTRHAAMGCVVTRHVATGYAAMRRARQPREAAAIWPRWSCEG